MKWIAHRFSGINCSDIRLRRAFLTPLISDFLTYDKALPEEGSNSDRAQLLALESKNSVADLGDSADDDGEPAPRDTEVL